MNNASVVTNHYYQKMWSARRWISARKCHQACTHQMRAGGNQHSVPSLPSPFTSCTRQCTTLPLFKSTRRIRGFKVHARNPPVPSCCCCFHLLSQLHRMGHPFYGVLSVHFCRQQLAASHSRRFAEHIPLRNVHHQIDYGCQRYSAFKCKPLR